MNDIRVVCVLIVISVLMCCLGCSKEERGTAINRLADSARVLNGDRLLENGSQAKDTPQIVKEQIGVEQHRQDTVWTPENQKNYPVQYCQAQLSLLESHLKHLDVLAYEIAIGQNDLKRKLEINDTSIVALTNLLVEAKEAYRNAEKSKKFPVQLNGFYLSEDKAQSVIVDISRRLKSCKEEETQFKMRLTKLELQASQIENEQKKVVKLRTTIQDTITELKVKTVDSSHKEISKSLDSIEDNMNALVKESINIPIETLLYGDPKKAKDSEFKKIIEP